ncbi:thiamine-phosphate kinase [Thalassiella azotivora]
MTVEPTGGLEELGEAGVLRQVLPRLPRGDATLLGPGDDAAVVAARDGRVVVTTDVVVEGRDFRREWSSAQDVGAKVAAQNLADVAAMGAVPTALVVALVVPDDLDPAWLTGLADGLAAACRGTGAGVVGGDLSSGGEVVVAVTALGDLQGREPVRRDGARAGDVVALVGEPGRSAAGLALLRDGWVDAERPGRSGAAGRSAADADAEAALVAAHRRPSPPYRCGPRAADAGATAMLDVSDGLLRDAGRVAEASGVVVDLDRSLLTGDAEALRAVAERLGADPWDWVLAGGEDHGLLATFPPAAGDVVPPGFRVVGTVRAGGRDAPGVLVDGGPWARGVGWDHFARG